jgi:sugar lactone lactonase YvrE
MRKVGGGKFIFEEVRHWGEFPADWTAEDAPGVAVDGRDRVFVLTRHRDGVLIFDRSGRFLGSWGEGLFKRPHGIHIGPDGNVLVVDDWDHAVHKFTAEGRLLRTIETSDRPSDTGYIRGKVQLVLRAGPPFNNPTGVALASDGSICVSDGYGNARVHRFNADGTLLSSWGEPGTGPGEFQTVHGVWLDKRDRVFVSDRMNARIQIFTLGGEAVSVWDDVRYPNNMCMDAAENVYVAEEGCVFLYGTEPILDRPPARITVRDTGGAILSEWGEIDPLGSGRYFAPHGIAVDSRGDLYISEVTTSYNFGKAPADWGVLRKYART